MDIVIAGSGFAGMWAALSAARAVALSGNAESIKVTMVSPSPRLVIRPRLYEEISEELAPDIAQLLASVDVTHVPGVIESIEPTDGRAAVRISDGSLVELPFDRFVLATGSQLYQPDIAGLSEFAFDVDQFESAAKLERHLNALPTRPDSPARNTVVVVGGGLTGIEAATEMPIRLRKILGDGAKFNVVLVDTAKQVGDAFGEDAQAHMLDALAHAEVDVRSGVRVDRITDDRVVLSDGQEIGTQTVVWAAGLRASPLAAQIPGEHDDLGRVVCDAFLRAPAAPNVFVTGDTAKVATDNLGNTALMTCQHALSLGRVAGHNAVADLTGLPLHPYSQPKYVTCIDLGDWGALYTEGWDRKVMLTQQEAKAVKREINTVWIYPPAPDRDAVFAISNPDYVIVP